MLTVADLRDRFGVTEHTVLTWIRSGELPAVNVGRRPGAGKPRWRVSPEALAQFEQVRGSGGVVTAPPKPRRAKATNREVKRFY